MGRFARDLPIRSVARLGWKAVPAGIRCGPSPDRPAPRRRCGVGLSAPRNVALLCFCALLAGCAGNRPATPPAEGYVQVDNPMYTMSTDAPAKIWVPKSSVEHGIPRVTELVKKGEEESAGGQKKPPAPGQETAAAAPPAHAAEPVSPPAVAAPGPAGATLASLNRIAVVETGQGGLAGPLCRALRDAGRRVALEAPAPGISGAGDLADSPATAAAYAVRLRRETGANVVVYVGAPEGTGAGAIVSAAAYDAVGGGLLRTFRAAVPPYPSSDPAARSAALGTALSDLAKRIAGMVSILPWYGRIAEVDGDRAYIEAGRETGVRIGQTFQVYRGGRFVHGLGFAPGERVGTLTVEGFVGPDGSFGTMAGGRKAQPGDLVAAGGN